MENDEGGPKGSPLERGWSDGRAHAKLIGPHFVLTVTLLAEAVVQFFAHFGMFFRHPSLLFRGVYYSPTSASGGGGIKWGRLGSKEGIGKGGGVWSFGSHERDHLYCFFPVPGVLDSLILLLPFLVFLLFVAQAHMHSISARLQHRVVVPFFRTVANVRVLFTF